MLEEIRQPQSPAQADASRQGRQIIARCFNAGKARKKYGGVPEARLKRW
jgi:hypothetical protein